MAGPLEYSYVSFLRCTKPSHRGRLLPLPALPIQYADFALVAAPTATTAGCSETQLSYWKQQLAGAPPVLKLPTTGRGRRFSHSEAASERSRDLIPAWPGISSS